MAFKVISAVIGSMLALMVVPTARAEAVLYGGLGGHGIISGPQASTNDGALVIVSQTTGSTTLVGHPAGVARISGLAFGLDGALFGATQPPGGFPPGNPGPLLVSNLIRIDPDTGALISSVPILDGAASVGIADLAVHPTTGTLYGIGGVGTKANGSGRLYTINTASGAATFIGDTHRFLASIAFAPDGKLYLAAADFDFVKGEIVAPVLATLDPANAAVLTSVEAARYYHSLAVRPTDGVIFGGTGDEQGVYTINPTSSAETSIGVTGRDLVGDFAFRPSNVQIAPVPGVWWNKNESGSGLGLDYENGTLIVEVYSYLAGGASQWYLAAGTVVNNVFTATLDEYVNGQCISCTYKAPALSGNDGTITITFTSPTTATADLPGGRHIQIERFFQSAPVAGPFIPRGGVWWNKNESGSGLGLDYENGTLIAEVYSYLADGASQWYLAAGTVVNNVFTATLDKYVNGQCISCTYKAPALSGNDGTITITFTSPTTATADLPGGRHIQIERFFQPKPRE